VLNCPPGQLEAEYDFSNTSPFTIGISTDMLRGSGTCEESLGPGAHVVTLQSSEQITVRHIELYLEATPVANIVLLRESASQHYSPVSILYDLIYICNTVCYDNNFILNTLLSTNDTSILYEL
jgi:hypothetical protein